MNALARWLGAVLGWTVVGACVLAISVAVLIPRIGGATPYTVLTGSMTPKLPPGTLVVVKPVSAASISVGDVVTYQIESGKPAVVTHRIVRVGFDPDGKPLFETKGDANNIADKPWVQPVQIKGKLWYAVPKLGYVNNLISGGQREIALIAIVTFLLGYAAVMFYGALRDRRQSTSTTVKGGA